MYSVSLQRELLFNNLDLLLKGKNQMAFLPTNASQVQQFAVALYGIQVGTTTLAAVQSDIVAVGGLNNALNAYYAASFGSKTTAAVAASVAANLGLTGTALTDGTAYITAALNAAPSTARGAAIQSVLNLFASLPADNTTYGAAAAAWNTKVAAAVAYTGAADAAVTAGSTVAVGSTFNLTSGVDRVTGTSGDDTFVADFGLVGTTETTSFQTLDSINGGAGTDTLLINASTATPTYNELTGTITSIENVIYTGSVSAFTSDTIDASKVGGLTNITFDTVTTDAANATTVSNLAAGQSVGIKGKLTDGGAATGAITPSYGATVTAATLTLDNAYGSGSDTAHVALVGTGLTELDVSGTTKKTSAITGIVSVTSTPTIKTLKVAGGSTQVNLSVTGLTGLTNIDLSASTGATTIAEAAAATSATTITGSAQKDTVTHSGTVGSTAKLTVALGAGDDTLSLTGTTDFTSANVSLDGGDGTDTLKLLYADVADLTATAKKATVKGFETLSITGATTTSQSLDASKLTAFSTVLENTAMSGTADTAAIAITKAQAAHVYSFAANVTGGAYTADADKAAVTLAVETDSASDAVSLSIGDAAATVSTTVVTLATAATAGHVAASTIDATDIETVNIASVGKQAATASSTAGTLTDSNVIGDSSNTNSIIVGANATIKVTGNKDLTITGAISGTNVKVDASALTGGISVTGNSTNNVLIGGASNNTIDGGAGVDTITGGAGKDSLTGGTGKDTIDGGAGDDKIIANASTSTTTASDADTLTGGSGADTFVVSALTSYSYSGETTSTKIGYDVDKITDFAAGTDFIALASNSSTVASHLYAVTSSVESASTLYHAAVAAIAAANSTYGITVGTGADIDVVTFSYGGKSYAYADIDSSGAVDSGDLLVDVTGVTGTLTKADFLVA